MDDLFLVTVVNRRQDLSKLGPCLLLLHPSVYHKVIIKLAPRSSFHNQEKGELGLDDLVEFDNVGVVQHFHDSDLPVQLGELFVVKRSLVDDFDGHLKDDDRGQRVHKAVSFSPANPPLGRSICGARA